MKNRFAGKCENCGKWVDVGKGIWRLFAKIHRNYTGLRCQACNFTTKKNMEGIERRRLKRIRKELGLEGGGE